MNYQELLNLEPGDLVKLSSQLFLWSTEDWDGIEERNCIFLKCLGADKHISSSPNPNRTPRNEFKKGKTIGTTGVGLQSNHVNIIQLFSEGSIFAIEACPEFVNKIIS